MRQTTAVAINLRVCERGVYMAVTALSVYHKIYVQKVWDMSAGCSARYIFYSR